MQVKVKVRVKLNVNVKMKVKLKVIMKVNHFQVSVDGSRTDTASSLRTQTIPLEELNGKKLSIHPYLEQLNGKKSSTHPSCTVKR